MEIQQELTERKVINVTHVIMILDKQDDTWQEVLVQLLKRAGRANNLEGAKGTKAAEEDTDGKFPQDQFYNHGVDSIDSNFRHMKKNISSDKADPGLGIDLAYFVENKVYKEYVRKHSNEPEQTQEATCYNHHAQVNSEQDSKL
ncbi:hypothetical protein NLI96_g10713 [Meripilus lineatus]|uniref:Uncharacterized protein n=1 Tax=Meripilus lineatus TaxID=2056292 RepID=A0AAD5UUS8_9APHY|nr:hypothetical protein NLI96_g10713 [Physisporinus lineatus]